ncbi:relaxin receptor 1 [Trichonephila inaurata madagascariensis]|uniref:Relaxin receptor 1 n=1 Tax=Trichonephila inaurata madagascariensis TaxID=2747483 RepID=A0A8X7BZG9_9ARAC|nr:relaxin receptor 1 [Trichonephila inaurata madagascariensis]
MILDLNATTWQPDIFKGLNVKDLDLEKIEVDDASFRPGRVHFQGLEESLETLEIKKSFKNGHRPLINLRLDHLSHLKVAIFEHNHIPEVGNDCSGGKSSTRNRQIYDATPASKLRTLDLAYNKLRNLPSDLFSDMPSLADVNLDFNLIHVLKEDTFSSLMGQVQSLSLAGNPLECDEKMRWICKTRTQTVIGKCILSETSNGRTVQQFCENLNQIY